MHRITQALMDSCLSHLAAVQPAASRWYTYEPAMTHVALGCLCHNVLGRAFACAFPDTPARKKRGNDDDDDWHARSIKKTRQANAYLSSIDNHKSLAIALVTTAPLDHLSARLQHLDAQQAWSLMNLCDSRTGPLVAAQVELASILYPKQCNGEPILPALIHHFGSVVRSELRSKVVALCAQLWARLEVTYFNWPWRLLGLVDPFLPDQSKRELALPTVERLCFAGHLATLMQDHLAAGMPDLRTAKALRRQALAAHAPIKANTAHRRALKKRGSARPHLQWCNARVAAWIDENPGASADAVTAQRRQAAAEWRNMSQAERGYACLAAAARAPRSCKSNITVTVPPSPPLWRISDERWPLSEYFVEQQLLKCCPLVQPHGSHGGVANVGIANRAKRLRRQCRENHVVRDVGDIPKKKKFMVRLPCHLAHYGVCRSVDEGIYKNVIDIGKRIETCFQAIPCRHLLLHHRLLAQVVLCTSVPCSYQEDACPHYTCVRGGTAGGHHTHHCHCPLRSWGADTMYDAVGCGTSMLSHEAHRCARAEP